MTFRSAIRLESVSDRTHSLIDRLNSTLVTGTAMMVVLDASPVSDSKEILGKIQFSVNDDLKITFGVIAPTVDYLSAFASRFNIASAHYCNVKFSVEESTKVLQLKFTPPNKHCKEIIRNFFEMTSSSFAE